jgi:UDP-glucose 4-epimerase
MFTTTVGWMFMSRIVVTGATSWTGRQLAEPLGRRATDLLLVDSPAVITDEHTDVVAGDLDDARFARTLIDYRPDVVIHLQAIDRSRTLGSDRAREATVIGAQGVFGAISRMRHDVAVIVKSDVSVYGAGPRNPSVFLESTTPGARKSSYGRDLASAERYAIEALKNRKNASLSILRFAKIVGPRVNNPLSRYFSLPVLPTRIGYDPRIQLLHEQDAVDVLLHTVDRPVAGTFNIASDGIQYLGRIARRTKRYSQPLPERVLKQALKRAGTPLASHLLAYLTYGLVMDTSAMRDVLGFIPSRSLEEALASIAERIS